MTFHKLDSFSFKDFLAAVFTAAFLIEVFRGHEQMVSILVPLISIILGGYFATEGLSYWVDRRNGSKGREEI
ncbi:MAG: hypothetical protein AB7V08_14915 [Elusimicrobiales bacterium]